jgi:two-component system chemotaxis response regulator CheY
MASFRDDNGKGNRAKVILVVEDDNSIRGLVVRVLKKEGYEVIEAINGRDALNKLHDAKCELVLTDIQMPELDGVDLIKQLRSDSDYKKTPIIVFSIKSRGSLEKRIKNLHINEWVEKPCKIEKLVSIVNHCVA